jgi:hypothetical protein
MNKQEKLLAIAQLAKTIGHAPAGRLSEFAEMIIEATEPNHVSLDVFNTFLPTRRANFGDQLVKRVRRGRYPVQTMVPSTNHLVGATDLQDTHMWVFDRIIAGARESSWHLAEPSLITVEKLITSLKLDLTDSIVARVFNLLVTAWSAANTPSNYIANSGDVTKANLDIMIENVIDRVGAVRAIVASRRALLPVYEFAGFASFTPVGGTVAGFDIPEVLLEYMRTGRVSAYKGIPLVELPQLRKNSLPGLTNKLIPEDMIVVVGEDAGEVLLYGETQQQEAEDRDIQPFDYIVHVWQQYGLSLDNVEGIGIIRLT